MKDILIDDQFELLIEDGDFVVGDSKGQNILLIAHASKGEYKRNPEIGANLSNLIHDESPKKHALELKRQLEYDGAKVSSIRMTEGSIQVEATYN
ncbi:MAG: hypothetical protein H6606_06010 [Flavobacteriales bacterium]|nr:hypothetical protein [Flavobacteriales bacterium]